MNWEDHMRLGNFEAAWRLSDRATRGNYLWDKRPLAGRRVVLVSNRGLGDAIQFVRYVQWLHDDVVLWARADAVELLSHARGVREVVPYGAPIEGDFFLELMELAYVFRTAPDTIPAEVPYIDVEPVTLPKRARPQVGVGLHTSGWDPARDLPESFLDRLQGVDIHRLDLPHGPRSPLETARLIRALDLVITADTFFAHLAGALAIPVWTLLPAKPNWRWLEHRTDSPWYPTMRLFRQGREGGWEGVMEEVARRLG
jgi:hypothetical protein